MALKNAQENAISYAVDTAKLGESRLITTNMEKNRVVPTKKTKQTSKTKMKGKYHKLMSKVKVPSIK